jgi:hypothetical protein
VLAFLKFTQRKKTKIFIPMAIRFVPLTPKYLIAIVWVKRHPATAPNVLRL